MIWRGSNWDSILAFGWNNWGGPQKLKSGYALHVVSLRLTTKTWKKCMLLAFYWRTVQASIDICFMFAFVSSRKYILLLTLETFCFHLYVLNALSSLVWFLRSLIAIKGYFHLLFVRQFSIIDFLLICLCKADKSASLEKWAISLSNFHVVEHKINHMTCWREFTLR